MGKSTSGPDWTDVEIYLRALDALHGVKTTVTFSADGIGSSGGLDIGICSTLPAIAGVTEEVEVTTTSRWPCPHCGALAEHIYGGLYKHDYGLGQAYQQQKWPV